MWSLIIAGVIFLVAFVLWQRVQRGEALIPLQIFRDRNFSVGTIAIVTVGFSMTSQALPLMFYLQLVQGLTPTQSALMMVPMAVFSIALARPVGLLIDRSDPRRLPIMGLLGVAASLLFYAVLATPETAIWWMLIPSAISGIAQAFMWGPLATLTTYNLKPHLAGAGSGVYNTSRQVGAVLGSATMAALMASRLTAQFGEGAGSMDAYSSGSAGQLPEALREGFATAMAQSFLLPAAALALGAVVAFWFTKRPTADL